MKLFLAILSLIAPAVLAADAAAAVANLGIDVEHRALSLASEWALSLTGGNPANGVTMPSSTQVLVRFSHGQGDGDGSTNPIDAATTSATYQLYEGLCPTGDNLVTAAQPGNYAIVTNGLTAVQNGMFQSDFTIDLDPSAMPGGTALAPEATFCIMVGLFGADGQVVNFREVLFEIQYDLQNDMAFTFTTAAFDPEMQDASIVVDAVVSACGGTPLDSAGVGATTTPVNQGEIICFYVCSGNADFQVDSVISTTAAQGGTSQDLLDVNGAVESTQVTDVDFNACRQIEFILDAAFFEVFENPPPTTQGAYPVTIVSGTVNFVDARRRLAGDRDLQVEEQSADFELELELIPSEDSGASAVLALTSAAAVIGATGAALLL